MEETGQALDDLEPVRHQDTVYEATVPATLCVAAVLARRAEQHPGAGDRVCVLLLDWPTGVARDSDDACVEAGQRYFDEDYPEGYPAMVAVRALRPVLCQGVAPFAYRSRDAPARTADWPDRPGGHDLLLIEKAKWP
ncbi:hypothetical protein ACH4E7_41245 [Kitasatospora sp. NPDC018058]|uniref:hypothetical protein n=1 Tax=Kitasatospora sp. NPDC018058 TaxID=3364025 RepID=UPI0037BE849B